MLNYAKFFLLPIACLLIYYLVQLWRYRKKGGAKGSPADARPYENMIALLSAVFCLQIFGYICFPPARANAVMPLWLLIVTVPPPAIAGLILGNFLPRNGRKGLLAHMLGGAIFAAVIIVFVLTKVQPRPRAVPLMFVLANWWLAIWVGSFLGLVYWSVRQTLVRRRLARLNLPTERAFTLKGNLILSAVLAATLLIGMLPYVKIVVSILKVRSEVTKQDTITAELETLQKEIGQYDIKGTFGGTSVTIPAMPNVSFILNDARSTRINAGMFQMPRYHRGANQVPKEISQGAGEITSLNFSSFPKRCIFEVGITMLCHKFEDQEKWCASRPEFADTLWCAKATKTHIYFTLKGQGWDSPQAHKARAQSGWDSLYSLSSERIAQIKHAALEGYNVDLTAKIEDLQIECIRMNTRQSCAGVFAINDEIIVTLNLAGLSNLKEAHVTASAEEAVRRAYKYWAYVTQEPRP